MRQTAMGLVTALLVLVLSVPGLRGQTGPAAPRIKVGDEAPDFTLKDQNGRDVSLKDFKGKKKVILAFYVFAFSPG